MEDVKPFFKRFNLLNFYNIYFHNFIFLHHYSDIRNLKNVANVLFYEKILLFFLLFFFPFWPFVKMS